MTKNPFHTIEKRVHPFQRCSVDWTQTWIPSNTYWKSDMNSLVQKHCHCCDGIKLFASSYLYGLLKSYMGFKSVLYAGFNLDTLKKNISTSWYRVLKYGVMQRMLVYNSKPKVDCIICFNKLVYYKIRDQHVTTCRVDATCRSPRSSIVHLTLWVSLTSNIKGKAS